MSEERELERSLGIWDATLLVVASVIGGGIFFTPGEVANLLPHPGWIALAWIAGGLISLAGALAFGELGAMFPHAGGDYVYLREGIHPVAGFLVGWLTFFAIYAGTIAALAAALADGVAQNFGVDGGGVLAIAIVITLGLSALNHASVRWGARANNLTSLVKVGALLVFGMLGPLLGEGSWSHLRPEHVSVEGAVERIPWSHFGLAMSPILFTFLGWNASTYVASEIREPGRNLPRSLVLGLALCSGVYLVMNAVYIYALPMSELAGVGDAGQASARALFGDMGGTLVGIFVSISILGTLNAMVLVGPRIAYAMARDGLFFESAGRVHAGTGTPAVAIWVQCGVAIVLLLVLRSFPAALNYTTFAIIVATVADMVALYRLRVQQPDRPRPYRTWGYPVVPAVYGLANFAIGVALLAGRPFDAGVSLGVLALGLPFYWLFSVSRRR